MPDSSNNSDHGRTYFLVKLCLEYKAHFEVTKSTLKYLTYYTLSTVCLPCSSWDCSLFVQGWTASVIGAEKITAGTVITETDEECAWLKPPTRTAVVARMSSSSSGDGSDIATTASSTYVRYQLVVVAPTGERYV